MLLCCQEFDMPNVIRLWDSLFADPSRYDFLNYVCVAIVLECRDKILSGDFAQCLEALQHQGKKVTDVVYLLDRANLIKEVFEQEYFYEQVNLEKRKAPSSFKSSLTAAATFRKF